jgi:hypothetical protein
MQFCASHSFLTLGARNRTSDMSLEGRLQPDARCPRVGRIHRAERYGCGNVCGGIRKSAQLNVNKISTVRSPTHAPDSYFTRTDRGLLGTSHITPRYQMSAGAQQRPKVLIPMRHESAVRRYRPRLRVWAYWPLKSPALLRARRGRFRSVRHAQLKNFDQRLRAARVDDPVAL